MDLKELRRSAGLTQQALATQAGCSLAYVTMLESGFSPHSSNVLPRILRVLDGAQVQHSEVTPVAERD